MAVLADLPMETVPVSPEIEATLLNVNTPEALKAFHDSVSP